MKLAVLSDIHAFNPETLARIGTTNAPSWEDITAGSEISAGLPFNCLIDLIESDRLRADFVICPGDIGHAADRSGIQYSWGWLESIRRSLEATEVLASIGNHDVDSHDLEHLHDPTNIIQSLQPKYPVVNGLARTNYFSKNFAIIEHADATFILLNTCAHQTDPETSRYGMIDEATLRDLKKAINLLTTKRRILICHHHPFRHEALDRADESAMKGGPELMDLLEENGEWLIIHGHRHYPNMLYGGGSNRSPLIVAAGSFSAILYPELSTRVRNQFLILEFDDNEVAETSLSMTGRVRAWEYHRGRGWVTPSSLEGIPDGAGFGYRGSMDSLRRDVEDNIHANLELGTLFPYSSLEETVPQLKFLLPRDRQMLLRDLVGSGVISVRPAENFAALSGDIFLTRRN